QSNFLPLAIARDDAPLPAVTSACVWKGVANLVEGGPKRQMLLERRKQHGSVRAAGLSPPTRKFGRHRRFSATRVAVQQYDMVLFECPLEAVEGPVLAFEACIG